MTRRPDRPELERRPAPSGERGRAACLRGTTERAAAQDQKPIATIRTVAGEGDLDFLFTVNETVF
jgi:hypothetical protein